MAQGKLQGIKITELFKFLIDSRTIMSMQLQGANYERLTCLIDVRNAHSGDQIVVDLPNDFKPTAEKQTQLKLRFNFNGPDKVEYIFSTEGGSYDNGNLILPYPDHVERLQRRRNFRLPTPPGTQMCFQSKKISGILDIVNISLGGAYGTFRLKGSAKSKQPLLRTGQLIYKIRISFVGQSSREDQAIHVQKAEVVRVEKDTQSHHHKYAFEFKYMDREERQRLIDNVYRLQREHLKRR